MGFSSRAKWAKKESLLGVWKKQEGGSSAAIKMLSKKKELFARRILKGKQLNARNQEICL